MRITTLLVAALGALLCDFLQQSVSAATLHVDASVPASGDGTAWETAFKTIQEGIDAASGGDAVVVSEGRYVENVHFNGKTISLRSTDPLDPDVVANTIIDGNKSGPVVTFAGTEDETCVLSGFTIRNGSGYVGGGISGGASPNHNHATVRNNMITGNWANEEGGGVAHCDGLIEANTISGNAAEEGGGGLAECGATIRGNIITRNTCGESGGGLSQCLGLIQGNLICGNMADRGGGLDECGGMIVNNTIGGNSANWIGGLNQCTGTIMNCIIWGNVGQLEGVQVFDSATPTYSCIEDWLGGGEGNITDDPGFIDPGGDDYRLSNDSPCIDVGKNEEWMSDAVDLDGNPRIANGTVDMGAFEFVSIPTVTISKDQDVVTLEWQEFGDGQYDVEWTDDIVHGTWRAAAGTPASEVIWSDVLSGETIRRFYRVESAGIYTKPVGFIEILAAEGGLTMTSVPLVPSDNRLNGKPSCIGNMIKAALTGGPSAQDADLIFKWDANTQSYQKAHLLAGLGEDYDGKWWDDETGDFSTMTLNVGECFWILRR